ncbi:unnamed protein product [Closterium sp. Naga37s-1]|nr:unnamed protein product [Closterium sp. Naga37s-1]
MNVSDQFPSLSEFRRAEAGRDIVVYKGKDSQQGGPIDAGGPGGIGETGGKDGKKGPPDAGPCPLPKPDDAQALGNLTAILAARLNGSEILYSSGDVNGTGRICLAVFQLDGDYNVFYSVVVSSSDAREPFAASIYQGAPGEEGTLVARFIEGGNSATWANLTRPPPPPPKGKKNKGTPPASPLPKYTYATNGTWLNASTLTAYDGKTIKELVDAIIAKPDGYYAKFSTPSYESGAARGQFNSDPLPPPPMEDGKNGGQQGGPIVAGGPGGVGETGGKDGNKGPGVGETGGKDGKKGPGVGETGGKDGKKGPPDAGPCPLPKPDDAQALGNLTAILAARLNGSEILYSSGDVNGTGRVCLAVFQLDSDYNVFYSVIVSSSDAREPFAASIYQGAAGEEGISVARFIEGGNSATWTNLTRPPPPLHKGKKNKGTPPALPPPKYIYATNGTWLKASTLTAYDGQTIKELVDAIIAKPDGYYAKFSTPSYESGAARGQFQSEPLPLPPPPKEDGKNGGKNGGGRNGGDKGGAAGTLVGVVGAYLNGSNADLTADVNATGLISLAVFLLPLVPSLPTCPMANHPPLTAPPCHCLPLLATLSP